MLLVIQKGSWEAGLEKVGRGNERAAYVYEERKKRRKRKRDKRRRRRKRVGHGLTVKCALVVAVAGFALVSLVF